MEGNFRILEIKERGGFHYALYSRWTSCECSSIKESIVLFGTSGLNDNAIKESANHQITTFLKETLKYEEVQNWR